MNAQVPADFLAGSLPRWDKVYTDERKMRRKSAKGGKGARGYLARLAEISGWFFGRGSGIHFSASAMPRVKVPSGAACPAIHRMIASR
jgi:hypothetical protein